MDKINKTCFLMDIRPLNYEEWDVFWAAGITINVTKLVRIKRTRNTQNKKCSITIVTCIHLIRLFGSLFCNSSVEQCPVPCAGLPEFWHVILIASAESFSEAVQPQHCNEKSIYITIFFQYCSWCFLRNTLLLTKSKLI